MDLDTIGTVCFALALIHTFAVKQIQHLSHSISGRPRLAKFLHVMGEVELVFGVWAMVFLSILVLRSGLLEGVSYVRSLSFVEPAFVFVIMSVSSTRPVLDFASRCVNLVSRLLPLPEPVSLYIVTLIVGPFLGSLITEPAAMTVTALLLLNHFLSRPVSMRFKYATLGLLFVNVSIGGTMTNFAAPPVLMVASKWGWSTMHMLENFGWRGLLACILSTILVASVFYRELLTLRSGAGSKMHKKTPPAWITAVHLLLLALIVTGSHYPMVFMAAFGVFLLIHLFTRERQDSLQLREALFVAFFLAGIVMLGPPQGWWLKPLLMKLDAGALYLGAISLTAITDNAALTYLGSQVDLSELERYALVAGSVVGGGLTVVANSPNPAGYGILNASFGEDGISPLGLFVAATAPTLIAALCFWL